MKRVEVDFNALTVQDHVRLTTRGAQRSVSEQGVKPGEWVWLTDGEMEVGAKVEADCEGRLYGAPAWETLVHLDPDPELSFHEVWDELQSLCQNDPRSSEEETRLLQLLAWFERIAPQAAKETTPLGFLNYRRAAALWALGHLELSLSEIRGALDANPARPSYLYLYLEILRKHDLDESVQVAQRLVAEPHTPAVVLAGCVNVLATSLDALPSHEFGNSVQSMVEWVDRFQASPGVESIPVSLVRQVFFNLGMALLRQNHIQAARERFETIVRLNPRDQAAREALSLSEYDDHARHLAQANWVPPWLAPAA
jgi:tetratricopeptide (TPR) repeat protein